MSRYIFVVPDMSCRHCVDRISKVLREAGVTSFSVELEKKKVVVEAEVPQRILDILEDAGYPSRIC